MMTSQRKREVVVSVLDVKENSSNTIDTGLTCLVMLARLFEMPANPEGLQHQFGQSDKSFSTNDILRAAKSIGLKAREMESHLSRLETTSLPCIGNTLTAAILLSARLAPAKF